MNIDFFLLGIVLILLHELDAIRCKEWRIFPILSYFKEKTGMVVFIFAHIPLFYWLLLEIEQQNQNFIDGFSIFLVIHFFLHLLFLLHKNNEFKDWISWSIITGAGLCGLFTLIL